MASDSLNAARELYLAGDLDAAAQSYEASLVAGADESQCRLGLGLIAIDQKRHDDAITHLKGAASADPSNINALTALGAAFTMAGTPAKAATILVEAVRRAPGILEQRLHLIEAFAKLNRFDDALAVLADSIGPFAKEAALWRLKGKVERQAGQPDNAYQSFLELAGLEPDNPNTLNDLGVTCRALGHYEDAECYYRQAIALAPDLAVAHANLGNILDLQGELYAAEDALRKSVGLTPDNPDFAYNLAAVLSKLERPDEAIPLLQQVTVSAPERWDAWTNLGVARLDCGDLAGAETDLRKALEVNPDNPEAHYNLAWLLLLTDRHADGWKELEWRWQLEDFSSHQRTFSYPRWTGEPLGARTLLLHAEQGFGDTIQFCRFTASIPKQKGRVILECQPALSPLLNNLEGVDVIVSAGNTLPEADAHAPLLSLPHLLGHDGAHQSDSSGYLTAEAPQSAALQLPKTGRRRIGLVWAGSPDNKIERRRHVDVDMFTSLFDSTDADFINLQIGPRSAEVEHLPQERLTFTCEGLVKDFADTATVIDQLDLVIGVDTAVMHLTGAMGKPGWILLPYMPDYRWGLGRNTTPWYDSVRLFRQPKRGDWSAVFSDVCAALRSW